MHERDEGRQGDDDLVQRFAALRAREAREVAPIARVIARRGPRRTAWGGVLLLSATAVAALALLMVVRRWDRVEAEDGRPAIAFAVAPGEMRLPTDFLLDAVPMPTPGALPQIGTVDWTMLDIPGDAPGDDNRRN